MQLINKEKNIKEISFENVRWRFLNKDETIITYCANFRCPMSIDVARLLLSLGYRNVLDYKGGLVDYKKANLPLDSSSLEPN